MMSNVQQLSDVSSLRQRARQHVENGAVTEGYTADRETILRLLNESLATELVCVLRYKRHYFMATGLKASVAADEFLEHATRKPSTPTNWPSASCSWAASRNSTPTCCRKTPTLNTWPATT